MIVPSILETEISEVISKLSAIKNLAQKVQIDIIDNTLVQGQTITDLGELAKLELIPNTDIHLLVQDPLPYLKQLENLPTKTQNLINFVGTQIEGDNIKEFFTQAKKQNLIPYLSLLIETPIETIAPYVEELKLVQLMSIEAGAQGRPFNPKVLEKIRAIKTLYPKIEIQIDGGITMEDVEDVLNAGANHVVIGSALFRVQNVQQQFIEFERKLNKYESQ